MVKFHTSDSINNNFREIKYIYIYILSRDELNDISIPALFGAKHAHPV